MYWKTIFISGSCCIIQDLECEPAIDTNIVYYIIIDIVLNVYGGTDVVKKIYFLIPGWSGNSPRQNFSLLREHLEEIPGIKVEIAEYLEVSGKFTKFRSKKSVEEYADKVKKDLDRVKNENPGIPIVTVGYSLGGLILRQLYLWGYRFEEMILAATPNKGFSRKFLLLAPLAYICKVKVFFQIMPGSKFLESLGECPKEAICLWGSDDLVVPCLSAIPTKMGQGILIPGCDHGLFPHKKEKIAHSAIPVLVEREKHKALPVFLYIFALVIHTFYTSVYKSFIFQHLCKFFHMYYNICKLKI